MKIAADWPPPEVLIRNELATLEAMANNLGAVQAELARKAKRRHQYQEAMKDPYKSSFSFNSWLEFPNSPIAKKASIECLISVRCVQDVKKKKTKTYEYEQLTYSFGLFKLDEHGELHLIKKFHIDFISAPSTDRPPSHPIFHLQSPGELSPWLTGEGINDAHLEPSLSEPRLTCVPTTLALLTDFLFREFGGDRTSPLTKVTSEGYWCSLIKKNEELVLAPYFKACHGFFCDRRSSKKPECYQLFSRDFLYGKC